MSESPLWADALDIPSQSEACPDGGRLVCVPRALLCDAWPAIAAHVEGGDGKRGRGLDVPAAPSPLTAVRRHCLDCCNGSANEVGLCQSKACPLWTFRMGRRPDPDEHLGDTTAIYPAERPLPLSEFAATASVATMAG